ncbi:spermidine synthase [Halopiger xanaduensis]|uniref:Spermine synthase n=1 Tax=Halopiger xanaduensis (strain DSM 18323 / JCM 14033 / SH-6) TaxID=797210 RepID=F8D8A9_HALXS|nr:fused MFS/spermidine synthase [Halopiger xanaduensis]AEH36816.1 Spermine synthase [Halopiger xanaduensis SH-6]
MDVDGRTIASYRPTKPGLAVFVSGVTSMGIEILALPIVAPQYGSHIYTVGGILTVCLAALSLGYWQGGKRAASATTREMTWIMLATAVYMGVVIYANELLVVQTSTLALPARYAALPSVIVLFGPPTYLLGFISPYAAELSAKEGTGEASGHVYALGTIGSIVGSGATTFVLIPLLTIGQIALLFGLMLVATALAIEAPSLPRKPTAASVVVAVLLVVAAGGGPVALDYRGDVVYETTTAYQQQLEVVDDGDVRTMYLDDARHSAVDLEDPDRHVFTYTKYFHLPMLMADDPDEIDRVLFIGGGGYTGPQDFEERYNATVDVVEIDPTVTDAAKEYFGLEENENLTVHTGDGRQYLERTNETYDLIVLDAYQKDQVPFHLTTEEFMEVASERLTDDGMLYANVISAPTGSAGAFYRAQYRTMDEVFPEVYSFRTSETSSIQNIEVVATKNATEMSTRELERRNDARDLGVDLEDAVHNRMDEPDTDGAPVLRDDRGGVNGLLDPMLGQRYVVEETAGNGSNESVAETEPTEPAAPAAIGAPSSLEVIDSPSPISGVETDGARPVPADAT